MKELLIENRILLIYGGRMYKQVESVSEKTVELVSLGSKDFQEWWRQPGPNIKEW